MTTSQRLQVKTIVESETKRILDAYFASYMYDASATGGEPDLLFDTVKLTTKTQASAITFERFKESGISVRDIIRDHLLMTSLMTTMDKLVAEKVQAYRWGVTNACAAEERRQDETGTGFEA